MRQGGAVPLLTCLDCDVVAVETVDGRRVEAHHSWPDDGAPHAGSSECGCGPARREVSESLVVYEHIDQDES
jgi:hypothetical protein